MTSLYATSDNSHGRYRFALRAPRKMAADSLGQSFSFVHSPRACRRRREQGHGALLEAPIVKSAYQPQVQTSEAMVLVSIASRRFRAACFQAVLGRRGSRSAELLQDAWTPAESCHPS